MSINTKWKYIKLKGAYDYWTSSTAGDVWTKVPRCAFSKSDVTLFNEHRQLTRGAFYETFG